MTIPPDMSQACADILIIDDELAMEGDEEFQVSVVPPTGIPTPPSSIIRIIDDDGTYVCT